MDKTVSEFRREIAYRYFYGVCFVCGKKYGKHFTYHHLRYVENEYTYKNFKNSMSYNKYILPIIEKEPNRFMLLCRVHHGIIDKKLIKIKNSSMIKLTRLFLATLLTEHR